MTLKNIRAAITLSFIHDEGYLHYEEFVSKLLKTDTLRMEKLHCGLGVTGEAGELADAIKKEIIYGKPLDRENIVEELGDLLFYLVATCNVYNIDLEEVVSHNVNKLNTRYASLEYSDKAAQERADKNPQPNHPGVEHDSN
jgi:NTP pyrophosphatase (non-canonical NTP hydrolase)